MGVPNTNHRPLVSGIRIEGGKLMGGWLRYIGGGTLTGLAAHDSNGKRVLVTNLHVVSINGGTVHEMMTSVNFAPTMATGS